MFTARVARAREVMAGHGIEALLVSVGADLPYLTGYEAMPLERLTMLVLPADGHPTLVVPALEAPRVVERPDVFTVRPWAESERPIDIVADLVSSRTSLAIGDQTWSGFLVDLQAALPGAAFARASTITTSLRVVKDDAEVEALRRAAAAVDRIATRLRAGDIPLVGQTEAAVSAELGRQILDEGHQRVNFAIVAAGANAASPHHEAGDRVIGPGEIVLCDFGGTMIDDLGVGYCSDITRCVHLGPPPADIVEAYDVLHEAQQASVGAATVGRPAEEVDAVGRAIIADAGYGDRFIHRTGHGIGVEAHEHPYIVEGNTTPLAAGHAFSVEPGIYVDGAWGMRLEDIVVATADGPDALNRVDHALAVLDG